MYCFKHNLIFIHIPKAAGTSIEWHLLKGLGYNHYQLRGLLLGRNNLPWKGPPSKGHLKALEYVKKGYLTEEQWNNCRKFTVVRNPYNRLVSAYNGRNPSFRARLAGKKSWSFRDYVLNYFPKWYEDNYVKSFDSYHVILPQYKYLTDRKNNIIVDDIFKLEALNKNFPSFLSEFGLDGGLPSEQHVSVQKDPLNGLPLPHNKRLKTEDYYDDDTIEFVKKFYEKDFELLGYDSNKI